MSYYSGDYYRGDPGFFSVLGGLAKKAVGFIPGVGPALSAGLETLTARKASTAIVKATEGGALKKVTAGVKTVIAKHPVLSAAAGAGAIGVATGAAGTALARRMRGGGMRKHKRMNPCNVRALRRAIRRAHGFEKIARRVMRFSSPHKRKKFAGFKHAKKRS